MDRGKGRSTSPHSENEPINSSDQLTVQPINSWKGYIWDTWELPPDQRWLLFKVDAFVLTFASTNGHYQIGYFLKNLDLNNINNAFLSGMKEDLDMYGNQLVTSTSIYTVGYVIGQIPSNLLLTRISPRWVIPALEVGWGIATICTSSVQSYRSLYAIRFLVGLFEWIGKRAMVFWLAGSIGTLFSGFLQAAAYTNLNGVHGHAGWRWLFIIDGIITLPLAVAGFLFFPNLPQDGKKTWWTTEDEHILSVKRMEAVGRAGKEPWTVAKAKRIFLSWHTYLLPLLYIVWNNGYPQAGMGYWLKSFNTTPPPVPGTSFSVPQINNYPMVTTGIFVVVALSWGWLSDGCRGIRWPFIYAGAIITTVFCVLLRQMPLYENINGRMAVYWLSNIGSGAGPLILSWINEICSSDTEKRALIVGLANDLAYVVQAVAPNFVWKTTDFPAARKGYLWDIILQCLLILVTAAIQFQLWRDRQKSSASGEDDGLSSDLQSDDPPQQESDIEQGKMVRTEVVAVQN
ncbi:major facilitator superfamily domain-containing protein [Aspergillus pseudotamarii]|uniref:Major facilitator superfamily domain-containing protein n=1 Tax=Aspergillus pseudotamarii TaxID=132259 RepID=A0A5N6SYV0_ASPPS|nr:major facilitator superfamily domain-containing protein [Aspergillus pseudotamarii]KAE8138951.1 major facilitator superfamily domain-containing protein [Aspergillus pseudotamarii]